MITEQQQTNARQGAKKLSKHLKERIESVPVEQDPRRLAEIKREQLALEKEIAGLYEFF